MTDGSDPNITAETQQQLSMLFDIVLNLCAQIYRMGVRSAEEFQLILDDLGMKG